MPQALDTVGEDNPFAPTIELEEPIYEDETCVAQLPVEPDDDPEQAIFVSNGDGYDGFAVIRPSHIETALEEGSFDQLDERSVEGYIDGDGALVVEPIKDARVVIQDPEALAEVL